MCFIVQASEVRGPPRTRSVCQRMAGCSTEATGFSGDEKYITVVKHVLPEKEVSPGAVCPPCSVRAVSLLMADAWDSQEAPQPGLYPVCTLGSQSL